MMNIFGQKKQELERELLEAKAELEATKAELEATKAELEATKAELKNIKFKEEQNDSYDGTSAIEKWRKQNKKDFQEEVEATKAEIESYYRSVEDALSAFFDSNDDTVEEIWLAPSTGLLKVSFVQRNKAQKFIWRCDEAKSFRGRGIEEKLLALGWRKHTFTMTDGTSVNWFQLEMAP